MKKYLFCAAAAAAACTFLPVLYASASVIVKNDLNDYDEASGDLIGSGYYEEIRLDEEEAAVRPALADSLARYASEHAAAMQQEYRDSCEIVREIRQEASDSIMAASLEYDILLQRDDEKVFSWIGYYNGYSGGAHGYHGCYGFNYDPESGKLLELTDICTDPDQLRRVLEQQLLEKYPDGSFAQSGGSLSSYGVEEEDVPFNWIMEPQGVTFLFNPYEIASYAEGLLYSQIRFADHPELFREDYTAGGSYAFPFITWVDPEYDLDGDGVSDPISVSQDYNTDGYPDGLSVSVGDYTCSLSDDYSYEVSPLLIHMEDGRNYLYIKELYDNDYRGIRVIDLNRPSPFLAGDLLAGPALSPDEETGGTVEKVLSDPACFSLGRRFDLLGTCTGECRYTVGGDGMPIQLDPWFSVSFSRPLSVTRDLPVQALDPQTLEPAGDAVIPSGEQLSIFRTDGISKVDLLRSSHGSPVRIELDTSVRPHLINGEDENSYFEMLYYAG